MKLRVSSPGNSLTDGDVERIEKDLEKIDRRLHSHRQVYATVRISDDHGVEGFHATLELEYGRNHLIAKGQAQAATQAVRAAREDMLRQINDRSRRGHSSFVKRT